MLTPTNQLDMSFELGAGLGFPSTIDSLDHFDFDSFLHNDQGDNADGGFPFDTNFGMDTGEVGAE